MFLVFVTSPPSSILAVFIHARTFVGKKGEVRKSLGIKARNSERICSRRFYSNRFVPDVSKHRRCLGEWATTILHHPPLNLFYAVSLSMLVPYYWQMMFIQSGSAQLLNAVQGLLCLTAAVFHRETVLQSQRRFCRTGYPGVDVLKAGITLGVERTL